VVDGALIHLDMLCRDPILTYIGQTDRPVAAWR
jgi:hypothetical protein